MHPMCSSIAMTASASSCCAYFMVVSIASKEAMPPPRIYLAGPEVFLPDALAVGARKAALCAQHGLEGVFPLDAQLDLSGLAKPEAARRISEGNERLMRS